MGKVHLCKFIGLLAAGASFIAGCSNGTEGSDKEITLSSASGKAVVSLKGARVLSWKDANGRELFFMPAKVWSAGGDWSHGGSLICWPWFGRKGTDQSLIHGFGRNCDFTVRSRSTDAGGDTVVLGLKVTPECNRHFPYNADLEITFSLTDSLNMKMKTVNLGNVPFKLTGGFQSYFATADYGKITFTGVKTNDFAAVHGMDKGFRRLNDGFGFKDSARGNEIRMRAVGNSGVVVWTPGTVEPANRNLAHDDCPKFLVLGPSNREAEGAIALEPGKAHEMTCSIKCVSGK